MPYVAVLASSRSMSDIRPVYTLGMGTPGGCETVKL
jgi:hypothetical protein